MRIEIHKSEKGFQTNDSSENLRKFWVLNTRITTILFERVPGKPRAVGFEIVFRGNEELG